MNVFRPENSELKEFEIYLDGEVANQYIAPTIYEDIETIYNELDVAITELKTEHSDEITDLKDAHQSELEALELTMQDLLNDIINLKDEVTSLIDQINVLEENAEGGE